MGPLAGPGISRREHSSRDPARRLWRRRTSSTSIAARAHPIMLHPLLPSSLFSFNSRARVRRSHFSCRPLRFQAPVPAVSLAPPSIVIMTTQTPSIGHLIHDSPPSSARVSFPCSFVCPVDTVSYRIGPSLLKLWPPFFSSGSRFATSLLRFPLPCFFRLQHPPRLLVFAAPPVLRSSGGFSSSRTYTYPFPCLLSCIPVPPLYLQPSEPPAYS